MSALAAAAFGCLVVVGTLVWEQVGRAWDWVSHVEDVPDDTEVRSVVELEDFDLWAAELDDVWDLASELGADTARELDQ